MIYCSDCEFWLEVGGDEGDCRRLPPSPVAVPMPVQSRIAGPQQIELKVLSFFPRTRAALCCGEGVHKTETIQQ